MAAGRVEVTKVVAASRGIVGGMIAGMGEEVDEGNSAGVVGDHGICRRRPTG